MKKNFIIKTAAVLMSLTLLTACGNTENDGSKDNTPAVTNEAGQPTAEVTDTPSVTGSDVQTTDTPAPTDAATPTGADDDTPEILDPEEGSRIYGEYKKIEVEYKTKDLTATYDPTDVTYLEFSNDGIKVSGKKEVATSNINGRQMEETPEDEYKLAQKTRTMHSLRGYSLKSPLTQSKERYYGWFRNFDFVKEFDEILDTLPDFATQDQCFVHTDIGPHNAMLRENGDVAFIDLDDTGIGSRYLDLGWPFIMQFVKFNHETEEMTYRFDLALAFLKGYYDRESISREEYDMVFQGAIQMHISYMQSYGPYAVDSLWKILKFGMKQKEVLWEMIHACK